MDNQQNIHLYIDEKGPEKKIQSEIGHNGHDKRDAVQPATKLSWYNIQGKIYLSFSI
jgi:hypothetical protein